jgi:iron-sulfur cluster assembly accessory protein
MALKVTERAARQARALLARRGLGPDSALRVFIAGNPIAGYSYGMALARRVDPGDVVYEAPAGVRVIADAESGELLANAELDYVDTGETQGFTVYHPNALHACHPIKV